MKNNNVSSEEYKNNVSCEEYKNKIELLKKEKKDFEEKISKIEDEIKLTNNSATHTWKQTREMCLYGQRYNYCENCGIIKMY